MLCWAVFCDEVDHPIVRLINDHQIVKAVLGISCLLDPTVAISCTVEDFWLGGKTPIWGIGAVKGDFNLGHHFGRFLSQ